MSTLCIVATVLLVVAGACFLLAAFGKPDVAGIALVPLGLLLTVAGLASHHHHPRVA